MSKVYSYEQAQKVISEAFNLAVKHLEGTLVIFFLQVLITACVFSVIVFILSLFYKGKTDDEIRLEETNRKVEEAKKALDTFSINK